MKKFLLLFFFSLLSVVVNAKSTNLFYSINGGVNLTNLTRSDSATPILRLCANGGVYYKFNPSFSIGSGVGYSGGATVSKQLHKSVLDLVQYNLDYITLPVLAKFFVGKSLVVDAGVQMGYLFRVTKKVDGNSSKESLSIATPFDLSIPIGGSWIFDNHVTATLHYNIGVNDLLKGGESEKNNLLQITMGYTF